MQCFEIAASPFESWPLSLFVHEEIVSLRLSYALRNMGI